MDRNIERLRLIRVALLIVEGFVGVSALIAGMGILTGLVQVPIDWIDNLPYPLMDDTVASPVFMVVVGGSCLGAFVVVLRAPGLWAAYCSIFCTLVVMACMAIELEVLGPATWLEPCYGVVTAAMAGLAYAYLWLNVDDGSTAARTLRR
jgi:hypothetical protein